MSLTLSTCNVLAVYKVLALTCHDDVLGVSQDRQTTKGYHIWCKYVLAARQNDVFNHRWYVSLLVHAMCLSFIKY